jgi:hypothetical protein
VVVALLCSGGGRWLGPNAEFWFESGLGGLGSQGCGSKVVKNGITLRKVKWFDFCGLASETRVFVSRGSYC